MIAIPHYASCSTALEIFDYQFVTAWIIEFLYNLIFRISALTEAQLLSGKSRPSEYWSEFCIRKICFQMQIDLREILFNRISKRVMSFETCKRNKNTYIFVAKLN